MFVDKKKKIAVLGLLQIVVAYLGFCISTLSYKGNIFTCITFLIFGMVFIGYFIIFSMSMGISHYCKQMHTINVIGEFVLLLLILGDLENIHFPGYRKILLVMLLGTTIICEIYFVSKTGANGFLPKLNVIKRTIKDNIELLIVLLLYLFLSVYSGGTPYKWDSRLYYITCQNLDAFSISDLAIYGHMAHAFGILMKCSSVLFESIHNAGYLMNVLVAMSGISAFYGVLKYICIKAKKLDLFLATSVYAFSAYMLGLVNYLSLDFYCASIFPVVVFFMLKREWIFHIITAFVFCFTKEPAILIYFGLCLACFAFNETQHLKDKGSLKRVLLTIPYWYMCIIGILWYITYTLLGPWSAGEGGIALELDFIWEKIKVMYLMNFGWFFTLICLLEIVMVIVSKKREKCKVYLYFIVPQFLFTFFSCIFQTVNHYRYNAITICVLCSISMISIIMLKKWYIRRVALGIACCISLCSTYLTIDPVSNKLFNTVCTGNGYMWTTSESASLGDAAIYNKQMLWAENVLNKVFSDTIVDGDYIFLQSQNNNIWYNDGLTDFIPISEGGYRYTFLWDEEMSQRVNFETDLTKQIEVMQISSIVDIEQVIENNEPEEIYSYISISDDNKLIEEIRNNYLIVQEKDYQYANWRYCRIRFKK